VALENMEFQPAECDRVQKHSLAVVKKSLTGFVTRRALRIGGSQLRKVVKDVARGGLRNRALHA